MLHLGRYLIGIDSADTQTTEAERARLSYYARGKSRAVEIGVYEGVGTRTIAAHMAPSGILFAVDPFLRGRLGICWSQPIARLEMRKARRATIHMIQAYSQDAVRMIEGKFDLLFIDGDHSDAGIRRDWNDWAPRMQIGGIVALHDTRVPDHHPTIAELGSYKFFESDIRHDPRFRLLEQVDSLSVLERSGS